MPALLLAVPCRRLLTAGAVSLLLAEGPCYPPSAPTLAPAQASDRILIVAPHVDDEAIAAAGYAAEARDRGAEVSVVYLTAGDGNRVAAALLGRTLRPRPDTLLREGRARIGEARRALATLGVPADHLYFLGYPDRGLRLMLERPSLLVTSAATGRAAVPYEEAVSPGAPYRLASLERDLESVLDRTRPTTVIAPVTFDRHPDHAAAGKILRKLLANRADPPRVLGYLVHAGEFPQPFQYAPTAYLLPPERLAHHPWRAYLLAPGSERRKKQALHTYSTQIHDPYLFLLLDAFVRRNELFVVEDGKPGPRPGPSGVERESPTPALPPRGGT